MISGSNRRGPWSSTHFAIPSEDTRVDADVQVAPDGPNVERPILDDAVRIVRGTFMFGLAAFYFAKLPCTVPMKLPALLWIMAVQSRTIGVGALGPVRGILRAVCVIVRLCFDYVTDADGSFDVWYWAFSLSLSRPAWNLIKYAWKTPMDSARASMGAHTMSGQTGDQSSRSAAGSSTWTISPCSRAASHSSPPRLTMQCGLSRDARKNSPPDEPKNILEKERALASGQST